MTKEPEITKIDFKDGIATVTIELDILGMIQRGYIGSYEMKSEVQKILVEQIVSEKGEEIKKEVLKDVNWPEIVRSEIAQKIISSIAKNY